MNLTRIVLEKAGHLRKLFDSILFLILQHLTEEGTINNTFLKIEI